VTKFIAGAAALLLAAAPAGAQDAKGAETYTLAEKLKPGMQIHHKLELKVTGKHVLPTPAKENNEQSLDANAVLQYPERIVAVDAEGMATKVMRHYGGARARFRAGTNDEERSLRESIRTMVGERTATGVVLWSPGGPLGGDERELVEDVLDCTRIPGLLPKNAVKVGDKWKIEPHIAQALCVFEALISAELEAKLDEVKQGKAVIKIAGMAHGMSMGAEAKIRVEAVMAYDIAGAMVERLIWAQSDSRAASPIAPQGVYQATITVDRDRSESPKLTDAAVAGIKLDPLPEDKMLVFEGPKAQYRLFLNRGWHVTSVQPNVSVLRLMQGTELIGQLSIAEVTESFKAQQVTQEEFRRVVETTNGVQLVDAQMIEGTTNTGLKFLKLAAGAGTEKNPLKHRHYLATMSNGKQMLFSYIFEPATEAKLGDDDLKIVSSLEIPPARAADKSGSTPR